MANDLFSGLGGLFKGLSGIVPQDTPEGKILAAQTELSDLQAKEKDIYAEIGKAAFAQDPDKFGEKSSKLKLIQISIAETQAKLDELNNVQQAAKKQEEAAKAMRVCPACGFENAEGMKFCSECGGKLGAAAKSFCTSCGAELAPGTKFCGECGARQV